MLGVVVPFLSIQPLIENAVRLGLAGRPGGGTVSVTAEDAGPDCVISVEDDGIGMDPEAVGRHAVDDPLGSHVGLVNVDDRLRAAFGEDYGLVVETERGACSTAGCMRALASRARMHASSSSSSSLERA